jgi:hypothetical protein
MWLCFVDNGTIWIERRNKGLPTHCLKLDRLPNSLPSLGNRLLLRAGRRELFKCFLTLSIGISRHQKTSDVEPHEILTVLLSDHFRGTIGNYVDVSLFVTCSLQVSHSVIKRTGTRIAPSGNWTDKVRFP